MSYLSDLNWSRNILPMLLGRLAYNYWCSVFTMEFTFVDPVLLMAFGLTFWPWFRTAAYWLPLGARDHRCPDLCYLWPVATHSAGHIKHMPFSGIILDCRIGVCPLSVWDIQFCTRDPYSMIHTFYSMERLHLWTSTCVPRGRPGLPISCWPCTACPCALGVDLIRSQFPYDDCICPTWHWMDSICHPWWYFVPSSLGCGLLTFPSIMSEDLEMTADDQLHTDLLVAWGVTSWSILGSYHHPMAEKQMTGFDTGTTPTPWVLVPRALGTPKIFWIWWFRGGHAISATDAVSDLHPGIHSWCREVLPGSKRRRIGRWSRKEWLRRNIAGNTWLGMPRPRLSARPSRSRLDPRICSTFCNGSMPWVPIHSSCTDLPLWDLWSRTHCHKMPWRPCNGSSRSHSVPKKPTSCTALSSD